MNPNMFARFLWVGQGCGLSFGASWAVPCMYLPSACHIGPVGMGKGETEGRLTASR